MTRGRLRRALVRGRRAAFWHHEDGFLVMRHPRGLTEVEVPIAHLPNAAHMEDHYERLAAKDWVTDEAVDELREIAAGAGR
jgi:hypothetical protein